MLPTAPRTAKSRVRAKSGAGAVRRVLRTVLWRVVRERCGEWFLNPATRPPIPRKTVFEPHTPTSNPLKGRLRTPQPAPRPQPRAPLQRTIWPLSVTFGAARERSRNAECSSALTQASSSALTYGWSTCGSAAQQVGVAVTREEGTKQLVEVAVERGGEGGQDS
eukprot:350635-Chlamydomonas_euryale.AAC.3